MGGGGEGREGYGFGRGRKERGLWGGGGLVRGLLAGVDQSGWWFEIIRRLFDITGYNGVIADTTGVIVKYIES